MNNGVDKKSDSAGQVIGDKTRHARGLGIAGDDLPMPNRNTEENMANSMDGAGVDSLTKGYTGEGSITGDTKSHDRDMKPGKQNQGNDELGNPADGNGYTGPID